MYNDSREAWGSFAGEGGQALPATALAQLDAPEVVTAVVLAATLFPESPPETAHIAVKSRSCKPFQKLNDAFARIKEKTRDPK